MDKSMITYLVILIISGFNVQFTESRLVSIKSNAFGYFLGCQRHYPVGRPSVFAAVRDDYIDANFEVIDVDRNTIALKSVSTGTYLSAQPGMY